MKVEDFLNRCAALIGQGQKVLTTRRPPPPNVASDDNVDDALFAEWKASAFSFLRLVFGEEHTHFKLFSASVKYAYLHSVIEGGGILKAALADLKGGFLGKVQELVAVGIFVDFLEQASHLIEAGYKDAAASITGAVLEDGLRRIAPTRNITVKSSDDLSALNHKLADGLVYNRLMQKRIQVWNDVRNNAAHGKFGEYKAEDVEEMIAGVESFLAAHLQA